MLADTSPVHTELMVAEKHIHWPPHHHQTIEKGSSMVPVTAPVDEEGFHSCRVFYPGSSTLKGTLLFH